MTRKIRYQEFFRKLHHKKSVRAIVYSGLLMLPGVGFYMHFIEPKLVKITRMLIPMGRIKNAPKKLRVVQISDLHFGPTNTSVKFFNKCIAKINALKPDIIAMTGDFMQWDSKFAKPLANLLSQLKAKHGVFASLGNHDYGVCHKGLPANDPVNHKEVIHHFEENGIRVLHNETITIESGKDKFQVVGLGDYWTEHFKPNEALEKQSTSPNMLTILLSHNPDSIDHLKDFSFDLMLAGHVHGGQVSFPFIGPLTAPVKNRHLRRGLHWVHERWLYTNRGLGHIFKARLGSTPEIACLDLIDAERA